MSCRHGYGAPVPHPAGVTRVSCVLTTGAKPFPLCGLMWPTHVAKARLGHPGPSPHDPSQSRGQFKEEETPITQVGIKCLHLVKM